MNPGQEPIAGESAEEPKRSDAPIASQSAEEPDAPIAGQSAEEPKRSDAPIAGESAEEPKRSDAPIAGERDCELCEAARFTHWYHEDETCWVADCEACLVPMVVWKPHGTEPSDQEVEHMLLCLAQAGVSRFGTDPFDLDQDMRTIPDHWHAHARDREWFRHRMSRQLSRYTTVGGERIER